MNTTSALRANFVGMLVRRQFKPGQPYVQLVFESSGRTLLALSRNVALVQSLKLGVCYRVNGAERTIGDKRYVVEPQLVPSPKPARTSTRARYAAFAAGGVLLLASGGVVAGLSLQANDSPKASSTTWHAGATTEKSVTVTTDTEKTASTPSATPTTTNTNPAATSKPKSTPQTNSTVSTPVVSNSTIPPTGSTDQTTTAPSAETTTGATDNGGSVPPAGASDGSGPTGGDVPGTSTPTDSSQGNGGTTPSGDGASSTQPPV